MVDDIIIENMIKNGHVICCGMKYLKYGYYNNLVKPYLNPKEKKWIVYDYYASGKLIYRTDDFKEAFEELLKPWGEEKKCDFTKN